MKNQATATVEQSAKFDIYAVITERIIEQLEAGIIPWKKPWHGLNGMQGATNYVTRRPYSLLNQMLLGETGEFITRKQALELGGKIKSGAASKMVVFWKMLKVKEQLEDGTEGEEKTIPVLKYFRVFSLADVEGIEPHKTEELEETETQPLEVGEAVIAAYLARESGLTFSSQKSDRAFYSPSQDKVVVPLLNQFDEAAEYYSTAFHEMVHSTLAESRCNRKSENQMSFFGNEAYTKEELVAELGSAMLCGHCDIETATTFKNSAAYIQSWLKVLKNDKKFIVSASAHAEKAARFILTGKMYEEHTHKQGENQKPRAAKKTTKRTKKTA